MSAKNDRASWIKAGDARCTLPPAAPQKAYRLVLLGAPGVGKGTQGDLICERLGPCQLSTGDVFRAAKCLGEGERTPAIALALEFMRKGELVPDETVINIVRERERCLRCRGGFLLDGFPRTIPQAEALSRVLAECKVQLDAVINYELPIDEVIARISGRRTCPACKISYHLTGRPPKQDGICDVCTGQLVQREDDRPEAVKVRMAAYETSTRPLIEYYGQRGLLLNVVCGAHPEETYTRTMARLRPGGPA